jgi:hypothetical protein
MKNIAFIVALALLSTAGFSQKVDFSGDWKFNSDKSEQGSQFSLAPNSLVVKHTKKTLEMERNSTWDGQDLTTKDFFTLDGTEVEILEEISMDGEKLVIDSAVSSSYGDMFEKFVFDKE